MMPLSDGFNTAQLLTKSHEQGSKYLSKLSAIFASFHWGFSYCLCLLRTRLRILHSAFTVFDRLCGLVV
jgi:hypothetical protein